MSRLSNDARVLDHAVQKIGTRKEIASGAGVGITAGTGTIWHGWVDAISETVRKATVFIDITGLTDVTAGDIIGVAASDDVAHIGRLLGNQVGTPSAGYMTCLVAPVGGDADINLYSAVEGTGAEDVAITTLDETLLLNAGDWTQGLTQKLAAVPAVDEYLYLVNGANTGAAYTAGAFKIEIFGTITL